MQNPLTGKKLARRWFLEQCGVGLGSMALGSLMADSGYAVQTDDPLAPKKPHFAPKAKRVIYLFMAGGPSQMELFDNKPKLAEFDGQLPPKELLEGYRAAFINPNSKLLGPKYKFAKYGQIGAEVSELLPHLTEIVDDIAIVRGMSTDAFNHAPGQILMNTGSQQFGRPSFGAWTTYGLGSETRGPAGLCRVQFRQERSVGGNSNWGARLSADGLSGRAVSAGQGDPVLYLVQPPGVDDELQRDSLDTIGKLNRMRLDKVGDPEIATRISAFEMAFRMQSSAPELMDISTEPQHILDMYGAEPGKGSFANNCLLARRLVEKGVRFVTLFHEAWDQHGNLTKRTASRRTARHRPGRCGAGEGSEAARAAGRHAGDLGRRVRPHADGAGRRRRPRPSPQRVHHVDGRRRHQAGHHATARPTTSASTWIQDKVHVHDLHATLLHLLGFDHKKLTYRFQGRDFRLTDVHGNVVEKLLA